MQTHAPLLAVWIISVAIGGLGILARFVKIPVASENSFWFVTVGFVVLAIANIVRAM